ncbi:MAG: metallophosphoesterase [Clostridia bacterium]|nr:metallophosphoesterase [Clostridia bacterium]
MRRYVKIILLILSLCFLFSGCDEGSPIDTSSVSDSISETLEQTGGKETDKQTDTEAPWKTVKVNGVSVREITIDIAGDGEAIEVVQISDVHFNAINDRDREENNELVMNSYNDKTLWLKDGASATNLQRCLAYAKDADQIVLTGDNISYLSYGNLELMKKYVFDPYPDVLACIGNHDPLRCWNAKVDESATLEERLQILQDNWIHDIYYTSKVIDERVMVIQLENASRFDYGLAFWESQVEPFSNDLALAREKGYAVLLYYHVPLNTGDARYYATRPLSSGGSVMNYYSTNSFVGSFSTGVDKEIYDLIINNGDIIKGAFCGHIHADYYTEIKATGADGSTVYIPQYIINAMPYDSGHVMKVTLK